LGKQIIGVGPSNYQNAGIREDATTRAALSRLSLRKSLSPYIQDCIENEVRRKTLRFAYTITSRLPQFVDFVKCKTPTSYVYKSGGDPDRLIDLLCSEKISPNDPTYVEEDLEESGFVDSMRSKNWQKLMCDSEEFDEYEPLSRRFIYKSVDWLRGRMKHGDR